MKRLYLTNALSGLLLLTFLNAPLYAEFKVGSNNFDHSVMPELQGDYWWEGKPEYRKYAGNTHFILNADGSGIFHFTKGSPSSFKWGVQVDENNKPQLFTDRHKELNGCNMIILIFNDDRKNDSICINNKAGHGMLGSTNYKKK